MAQKKGGGSTRNGRDSKPKMLGVKAFGGEHITAGASSSVNVAPNSMLAPTLALAKTTPCSLWSKDMFLLPSKAL